MDRTIKTRILTLHFLGRLVALCIIVCLTAISPANAVDAGRAKRVMMLSTENRFAPAFILAEQAARDGLQTGLGRIEFYAEYLDGNRFPGEDHRRKFAEISNRKGIPHEY